jgi:hypothetical protein
LQRIRETNPLEVKQKRNETERRICYYRSEINFI